MPQCLSLMIGLHMRRLPREKRAQILAMLVESMSMRATARVADVSFTAVAQLLDLAGIACKRHHDQHVRGIKGKRQIQCDELWSFVHHKDRAKGWAKPIDKGGTVWTFTAIDADTKLLVAYMVRMRRNTRSAVVLMRDLADRLNKRPKMTADSPAAYRKAAKQVFRRRADLSQTRKGEDTGHSTAYVERHNLTIRMSNRRYTRKTNAFSKRLSRHESQMHLSAVYYNFCWLHGTLRVSPAMAAGVDDKLRDYGWLADLVAEVEPKPKKPGPKKGTKYRSRTKGSNLL